MILKKENYVFKIENLLCLTVEERCSSPTRKLLKTMKIRKSLSSTAIETKSRGTIDVYIKYPARYTLSLDAARERRQRYNSMSDEV